VTRSLSAELTRQLAYEPQVYRIGTITGTAPGALVLDGTSISNYRRLSSYTPQTGDVVLCASVGTGHVVLGKIVTP
jgi:hypothetical protein